jgi:hypothetical protein
MAPAGAAPSSKRSSTSGAGSTCRNRTGPTFVFSTRPPPKVPSRVAPWHGATARPASRSHAFAPGRFFATGLGGGKPRLRLRQQQGRLQHKTSPCWLITRSVTARPVMRRPSFTQTRCWNPSYMRVAEATAERGLQFYHTPRAAWPCGVPGAGETPSLLLGLAGIGYFYLRMFDPDACPSVLMVHPRSSQHMRARKKQSQ